MSSETEINNLLTQIQEIYYKIKLYEKIVWIFLFLGFILAWIFFLLLVAKRKKLHLLKSQLRHRLNTNFTNIGLQKNLSFQKTYLNIINPNNL